MPENCSKDKASNELTADLMEVWDAPPADLCVSDLPAWIAAYRKHLLDQRSWNAEYTRRVRERKEADKATGHPSLSHVCGRDKAMLETLLMLMERAGTRVFDASSYDLVFHGGVHRKTVVNAVRSLRKLGYVLCLGPTWRKDEHGYSLYRYALTAAQENEQPDPAVPRADVETVSGFLTGDYSHDVYAGHRGFKGNRREVHLWFIKNPGQTMYACHKATGIAFNTVSRAVAWLVHQDLAARDAESGVHAFDVRDKAAVMEHVAVRNRTVGKTDTRMDYMCLNWMQGTGEQALRALENKIGRALPAAWRTEARDLLRERLATGMLPSRKSPDGDDASASV